MNWMDTTCQGLKVMELTWEQVQQLSVNEEEWHHSVAECVFERHGMN